MQGGNEVRARAPQRLERQQQWRGGDACWVVYPTPGSTETGPLACDIREATQTESSSCMNICKYEVRGGGQPLPGERGPVWDSQVQGPQNISSSTGSKSATLSS